MSPKKKLHVVVADVEVARSITTARIVVPLVNLSVSQQHQYRHHFDDTRMSELAESVRRVGIQQPPWVRAKGEGRYEIIAGERRFRAARIAGLEEIACDEKRWEDGTPIDDEMAFELAVIENNQRENPHPLEESDAYVTMRERFGYSAERIAGKIRRSVSYVYERLALADLCKDARSAFWAGQIGIGVALVLARITHAATQAEAVETLTRGLRPDEAVSLHSARDIVARNFLLQLHNAPFDAGDADLILEAGSCTTCPKRSGNQGLLFDTAGFDKKTPDSCTDRTCWEKKRVAGTQARIEDAKARGVTILEGSAAKELFSYGDTVYSKTWIDLAAQDYQYTQGKTWRQVLGRDRLKRIKVALAKAPSGALIEIARRSEVIATMRAFPKDSDPPLPSASAPPGDSKEEKRAKRIEDTRSRKVAELATERARAELIEFASGGGSFALSRAIVKSFSGEDSFERMMKRRQLDGEGDVMARAFEAIDEADVAGLVGLLTEIASFAYGTHDPRSTVQFDPLPDLCRAANIDFDAIRARVEAEVLAHDEDGDA